MPLSKTQLDFLTRMVAVYESIGWLMGSLGISRHANAIANGQQQIVSRFATGPSFMLEWEVDLFQRALTFSLIGYGAESDTHASIQLCLKETGWILKRLRIKEPKVPAEERRVFAELVPGTLEEQTLTEEQAHVLIEKIVRDWKANRVFPKTIRMAT